MSKRRGNGEDSIYKDGDRWRGAISLGYSEDGRRIRKKVSGRTRAEVVRKLKELREAVDAGVVPDDQITVKAFLERWVAVNLPGTVAESTEDDYGDMVRLHLVPALGRKKLSKLTVADVDRLWNAKREAGYAANSRRNMRNVLRRALAQAEKEGLVTRNVAALSAAPRTAQREGRTLTLDQAKNLLKSVEGHRYGGAITVALAYGLRRGEVLGLRWENLDWEAGTLRLTHAVKRIKERDRSSGRKTRIVLSELKTARSRRTLVLTPEIMSKLRKHHAEQAEARLALGESGRITG